MGCGWKEGPPWPRRPPEGSQVHLADVQPATDILVSPQRLPAGRPQLWEPRVTHADTWAGPALSPGTSGDEPILSTFKEERETD